MIACIYEGGAEKAVLDLLMENECLYFSKADLLSGDFIRRVSGKVFASRFLGYSIKENSIDLIRVQDSRRADLGLPSTYRCKIRSEVKCLTRPEIEMLVIIAEDCYEDFQKRRMKPSHRSTARMSLAFLKSRPTGSSAIASVISTCC